MGANVDPTDHVRLETIAESSKQLAIGKTKTYQLIAAGELETVKRGPKAHRVLVASRHAYVKKLLKKPV